MTDTITTADFCARHGITATVEYADRNPNTDDWSRDARHWTVTLHRGRRRLTTPFSQGSAHTDEPTAADVLECLISDSIGPETFDEWCRDLGFDTDSRKAERIYQQCAKQTAKLRVFLGPDLYDAAQQVTR